MTNTTTVIVKKRKTLSLKPVVKPVAKAVECRIEQNGKAKLQSQFKKTRKERIKSLDDRGVGEWIKSLSANLLDKPVALDPKAVGLLLDAYDAQHDKLPFSKTALRKRLSLWVYSPEHQRSVVDSERYTNLDGSIGELIQHEAKTEALEHIRAYLNNGKKHGSNRSK